MEYADLQANPEKYGFCTFEQFRKDPRKWRPDPEMLFTSIQNAGTRFKQLIRHMRYELCGYRCDTLETVQSVCRQMGLSEKDLTAILDWDALGGQKYNLTVRFITKEEDERRRKWA